MFARSTLVFILGLALPEYASAQTQVFFDTNGTTAGSSSTPVTWAAAAGAYWSTNVNGTTFTPVVWNSVTGATTAKNATFSAGTNATGTYTVTVSGIVDYVGGLTFEEGTVTLAGGTLNLRQTALANVAASQATISSIISSTSGTFGLTKTGTGTLFLSGANTYTGPTAVQDGTLSISTIGNVSGGATALGAPTTVANGTIKLGNTTTGGTLAYTGATATTNRVIDLAGTTGGATLDASGSGPLTLTSAFTATGAGSKTLSLIGSSTANNTISGAIVNNSGTNITSLAKSGTGTWVLSGNNSYTGTTTISQGTLKLGATGSLGNGPLGTTAAGTVVSSGGALDLNGFTLANSEALSLSGSGVSSNGGLTNSSGTGATFNGVVTLAADATIGGAGNITLGAGLTDGGTARTLTKTGAGTLLLNAAAGTWTTNNSLLINGGTVQAGITSALGASALSNITVNATTAGTTATFALGNSVTQSIGSLTFGGAGATSTSTNSVTIGTSSTLTLGGNVTVDATNNPLGSSISGGTLSLGAANRTFTINSSSNAPTDLAISSVVGGTGGLIKAGAGTLALSGTNTYGGPTTINAGVLSISSTAGLGSSSTSAANLIFDGGTLKYTGGAASSSRSFTLGVNGGTIDASGSGALSLSSTGTIATSGSGARTLTLGGTTTAANSLFAVVADGTGGATSVVKTGVGTWLFDGNNANTYSGGTTILGGILQLSKKSGRDAAGTGDIYIGNGIASATLAYTDTANQLNNSTAIFINDNGTFDTNGRSDSLETIGDGLSASGGTGRILLTGSGGNATLTLTSAVTNTQFSGVISGAGSLDKTAASTLTLAGANTYSGTTTLSAGVLNLNNAAALGTSTFSIAGGSFNNTSGSAITLNNNAQTWGSAVNFTGSNDLNMGTGAVAMNSNTAVTVGGSTLTVGGVISGGGSTLTKMGAGTLSLTGTNTYSGVTTISQGKISVGANSLSGSSGALGNATSAIVINNASTGANDTSLTIGTTGVTVGRSITVANNGTGITTIGGDSALTSGTGTFSGAIALNKSAYLQAAGTSNIIFSTGAISGTGGLTKTGSGTATLSGTNTYSGTTTVSQGTLAVTTNAPSAANGAFGNASSAVVINDASTGSNNTALTIATSGVTVGRAITVANSGSGTTTIGGATSLTSGTGTFSGNIALNRSAALQAAGTSVITFGGTLSGAGGLSKIDSGTATLTGTNTFTGGVTVSAGTLRGTGTTDVGGFNAFGNYSGLVSNTDVITVANGATLEVQSSYTGDVGNGTTNSFKNLVLNGTGFSGGGALRSTGGNSTWTGNTVLGSNATITNAGTVGDANELFLGAYIANTDSNIALNGNTLTLEGTGNTFITSKVGATAGDVGSVIINGGTNSTVVTYSGYANYYTGSTTVNSGQLVLAIAPSGPANSAILGNLTIGSGSLTTTAKVTENYLAQIADTSTVTINSDGTLDLATTGVADTIASLTLNGGTVTTGTGELNIANGVGTVDVLTSNTSTIAGKFHFLATTGTINVDTASTLLMSAKLYGTNVVKAGNGKMIVTSDNITNGGYLGTTSVTGGTLNIQNSSALGAVSAGTTVSNGATLQLENTSGNVQVGTETLTLNGAGYASQGALNSKSGADNRYGGAVTLGSNSTINTDAGNLTITGSITGTAATSLTQTLTVGGSGNTAISGAILNGSGGGNVALTKADSGTVTLSGANSFTGAIAVNAGTLAVTANNSLGAQTNAVNVASGATFALSGGSVGTPYTNTIKTLTGSGLVSIAGSTTLKVNTPSADTFDGRLSGAGLFEKAGAGTFTFSSTANTSAFNFAGTVQLTAAQYVSATDTFTDGIGGTLEFKGGSIGNALTIGTLNLTGGTLLLTNSFINVGTLNITGNTVLDFGTSGASTLNATNIYIAAGALLTVKNWNSEVDFLFANSDFRQTNGSGTLAVQNAIGTAPENQVAFKGDPWSPDGSHTTWIDNATAYYGFADNEIRPVPEPSTYGILMLAGCAGVIAYRRLRKQAGQKV